MVHTNLISCERVIEILKYSTKKEYSGKIEIQSSKGYKWCLYYKNGRIIWANGGIHPCRRWRRTMSQYCSQIKINDIQLDAEKLKNEVWDYQIFRNLYQQKKIDKNQVEAVAKSTISEVLFDIAQQVNFDDFTYNSNSKIILDISLTFMNTDFFLNLMKEEWYAWSSAGLSNFSPHLSPQLLQTQQVQELVTPSVYNNFVNFINGKYTLRDLAIKLNFDVLKISSDLLPFILRGFIQMSEVCDLPLPVKEVKKNIPSIAQKKSNSPLIACIDDSLQVCQTLDSIITSNKMRFIKIQDAIQALPVLIEKKPDLILLDLIMPVVNGYEVCSQIRRVGAFSKTPIIILTSSEGLFDRFRAKVAGSTDFMTKPIIAEKLLETINKYLKDEISYSEDEKLSQKVLKPQLAMLK